MTIADCYRSLFLMQATENNPLGRQDLNESTLDLSLGLNSHDDENDPDSRTEQTKDS